MVTSKINRIYVKVTLQIINSLLILNVQKQKCYNKLQVCQKVLGPILFIIYRNDDISFASNVFKFVIYADGSTINNTLTDFNINCNNNNYKCYQLHTKT